MRCFLVFLYSMVLYTILGKIASCSADESTGFFVKVTKNVPRLGRRTDKDFARGYFRNYKVIPRIGRSVASISDNQYLNNWLQTPSPSSSMRNLNKRKSSSLSEYSMEKELNVVQPVNTNTLMELITSHAIPNDNVKFVHWKDFDKALQLDNELYVKVSSLGRVPDQQLKNDITEGNYDPLMSGMVDEAGTDFILYNQGEFRKGPYAPEFLRYNTL